MNRPMPRQQAGNNADFKKYLFLILRNWYWFVLSLALALSISKLINVLSLRTYRVSCEIAVGDNENSTISSQQIIGGIDFNEVNPINKEIGILKSKNLAEQTIRELDFNITYYELIKGTLIKRRRYNELPFLIVTDSVDYKKPNENIYLKILGPNELELTINNDYNITRQISINEKLIVKDFSFSVNLKEEYENDLGNYIGKEFLFYFNSSQDMVNEFWKNLNVQVSPTSQNILILSLIGENIFQANDYLNKICELYDKNDLAMRNRMASNTLIFIDNQLGILNKQLLAAEDSLIKFKRKYKIYNSEISNTISNEFISLEEKLLASELELRSVKQLKLQLDTIINGKNIILPVLFTLEDSRLSGGIENINSLVIERDVLLKNQNNKSPAVIRINQQIQVEALAFKSYLDQTIENSNSKIQRLKKNLAEMEAELIDLPTTERQLAKLMRDFEMTENLYNLYQQKRIEAKLAEASTVSNIRMLDPPDKESAVLISPRIKQNNQTAILLGLVIPALFLVLLELLFNRVRYMQDITNQSNVPVLGKLAHSKADYYLPTKEYPWAGITESFRTLHAKLKYLLVESDQKVIAITSGSSGDGKTFCAMNLATVMAGAGKKILLIGLDLRRPKIHDVFEIDNEIGFTTYLIGNNTKDEIIHQTSQKNLFLINSGPIPPNPVELIEHKKTNDLIQDLKKEFDYIIIDSPPIGLVADAMLLNKFADVYLFVIRMDHTRKNILNLLGDLQGSNSLNHLSLVFNDIKQKIGYGYGYGYGYYNSYYKKEESTNWKQGLRKFLKRR